MSAPGETCRACGADVLDIDVHCGSCGAALSSTGAQRMIGSVVLEHYEVTDILGQGGMSVVYRGKHKITGQEVALKVLPPELAAYRDVKGRFLEEGRALAQLDHPNIVHLYNFGDDGECLVLAMQFVRGVTWERMILEGDKLPWRRSAELARDVSNALDYAHGRGIIHRDMKPSNVLVRELDGAATVMDFGIAKVASSAKLTATGQTMGTVRYMSPEQVRGLSVGVETDIYSLAMTMYESLVGDTPFSGDTHFEIMTKHLSEEPVPPSKRGVDLPPALEAVLMRAISKMASDRQSSALQFKEQLQAVLDGEQPAGISVQTVRGKKLAADGSTELSSSSAVSETEIDDPYADLPTGKRPARKRGLAAAAAGVVVVAAVIGTFALTQGAEEGTVARASSVGSSAPVKAPRKVATSTASAFRLPGHDFAVDETFPQNKLRVLLTRETSAESVRLQVIAARKELAKVSREAKWPIQDISRSLSIAVVPAVVFCNPELYDDRKKPESCTERNYFYRPMEGTLYVLQSEEQGIEQLAYRLAEIECVHGTVPCEEVIETWEVD